MPAFHGIVNHLLAVPLSPGPVASGYPSAKALSAEVPGGGLEIVLDILSRIWDKVSLI